MPLRQDVTKFAEQMSKMLSEKEISRRERGDVLYSDEAIAPSNLIPLMVRHAEAVSRIYRKAGDNTMVKRQLLHVANYCMMIHSKL